MKVSVVIICMNNLGNLYPCLDSIIKHTHVSYEIFVVAFMFSDENLQILKRDYPSVKIVESNELRGFSENNNLALRKTIGEYCYIVNDDTLTDDNVIDKLCKTFDSGKEDNIAIVSPLILNKDGSVQRNGKCPYNIYTYCLQIFKLKKVYDKMSKYTGGSGIYQTYNISGSCFMIKRDIFEKVGWLDERYYFCPEDIALSTKINKIGFKCIVNTNAVITHIHGGTWSKILPATMPTAAKGNLIFYTENNAWFKPFFILTSWLYYGIGGIKWWGKYKIIHSEEAQAKYTANINCVKTIANKETPKQLFVRLYNELKRKK